MQPPTAFLRLLRLRYRRGYTMLRPACLERAAAREDVRVTTMLAARLYETGQPMKLEQVPVPQPRPTDVLIAVKACGVVPNLINVLTHWQSWFPELPLPKLPAIFGLDVAGIVAGVGAQVQNFRQGQRVYVTPGLFCGSCPACRMDDTMNCTNYTFRGYFGFGPDSQRQFDAYPYGGMCEYITAPQHNLVPIPDNVAFEAAARFGYIGTAYAALRKAQAGPGSTILINGLTGTLGLGATLCALGRGVTRILGTARDRGRLERVKALAPERIEVLPQDEGKAVADWARSFTAGHGADAVIDCLGPGTPGRFLMDAIYALRRGGKAINIGGVGEKTVMDIHWMMDNQIEFIGSNWFNIADAEALAAMAAAGTLDLSVFQHVRVPLAEVNRALDGSQFRDGGFTNVVVVP
jgi:threonine dehydrogenase-like Zn-dependent dehydrogenase